MMMMMATIQLLTSGCSLGQGQSPDSEGDIHQFQQRPAGEDFKFFLQIGACNNLRSWAGLNVAPLGLSNVRPNLIKERFKSVTFRQLNMMLLIYSTRVDLGSYLGSASTGDRASSPGSPLTAGGTRRPTARLGLLPADQLCQLGACCVCFSPV